RFDGTMDRKSPYKGPPNHDVDVKWDKILPLRVMSIPEPIFQTLNASNSSVKTPSYLDLPPGRIALFDTMHHLHCVRELWKSAYPNYYTAAQRLTPSQHDDYIAHLDHCVDMLRQKLMCDSSSHLITYNWLKGHSHPHPNFNVEHKCKSYDDILEMEDRWGIKDLPKDGFVRGMYGEGEVVEFGGDEPPFDPRAEGSVWHHGGKS
ncbi:hypothetical protein CC80DRAFT_572307, partial [Byssothecium circinans]